MTELKVPASEQQAHHINQERARIVRTLAGTAARSARSSTILPAYPREAGALSRRARAAMPVSLTASTPRRRAGAPQQRGSHRHSPRWLLPVLLLSLGIALSLGHSLATAKSVRAVACPDGPDKRPPVAGASFMQSTAGGGCATSSWAALGEWCITAYCPGACCCGKWADGRFADGSPVEGQELKAVAAPREIPLGSTLYIEGIGPVIVRDRGGAIKGQKLDLFHATHSEALRWGVHKRRIWIQRRR